MFTNLVISIYINSDVRQEKSHEFQTAHLLRPRFIAKHHPLGHKPKQSPPRPQTLIIKIPQARLSSLKWLQSNGSKGRSTFEILCWYDHQQ